MLRSETNVTINNTQVQQLEIHFGVGPTDDEQTLIDYTVTVVGFN